MLEDYYSSILKQMEFELLDRYYNRQGKDISDIIRGKILMLQQFLATRTFLEDFDKIRETMMSKLQPKETK